MVPLLHFADVAPLANWSHLTDPCFFLPFHLGHFGRCRASSCLCALEKPWLGSAPYITLGTFSSPGFLRYGFRPP